MLFKKFFEMEEKESDIRKHLRSRSLDPDKTRVHIDDEKGLATFPIFNKVTGQMIGYQQYNPAGAREFHNDKELSRYFTYITPEHRGTAAWGTESMGLRDDVLFLVEGIFDAAKLHAIGMPALAILTNSPHKQLVRWLQSLSHKVIGIMDNDPQENRTEGQSIGDVSDEAHTVPDPFKDIGEMSDDEAREFIDGILKGQ